MANVLQSAFSLVLLSIFAGEAHAQVTRFPVPTSASRPYTIVPGPDGALWFTESNGNKLGRITPAGTITEFPVPTAASGPYGIAVGRDGNIWFTERFGNKIGRFTPSTQTFREFRIPTPFAQPWEIALGADGNLWFTEEDVNQIGRIAPNGGIREFVPPTCCFPTGIAAGPDGRMWYTQEIGDQIGRVELSGTMTMFTIPNIQVLPWDITAGPDGAMWFTELSGRAVGRITTSGQIVENPIAGPFSGIAGVTPDFDGNLWCTENDTDHLFQLDTAGNVQQLLNTAPGARPLCITLGPDGNLWFTEADTNAIGRLNVAQPGRVHVLAMDAGFTPALRTAKLGERFQWVFLGPSAHAVVDASGLGLFDSGARRFVTTYTLVCLAASTFVYRDPIGGAADAAVSVPVDLPATATAGVAFPLAWARVRLPAPYVFDVQVSLPGSGTFVDWLSTQSSHGSYVPLVPGSYAFRARLRHTGTNVATLYSIPAEVTAQ